MSNERLSLNERLRQRLDGIAAAGLMRTDAAVPVGLTSVCGNDYLGLRAHPSLQRAAHDAMRTFSAGAAASRLVGGTCQAHVALEARAARWLGTDTALAFPSGYQANVALLSSLPVAGDHVVSDALNHASIIDGIRLSRAARSVVPHGDLDAFRAALAAPCDGQRFVVTESIFSMDGDAAPLTALAALCDEAGAALIVDEAHAIGVRGEGGRGLARELGVQPDVTLVAGGKALGAAGGIVCCSAETRRWLVNRGRGFIYSTGLAPPLAGALQAAIDLIEAGDAQRLLTQRRQEWSAALQSGGLHTGALEGAIVPFIVGENAAALELAAALQERGFFVQAIRPPTVPIGTSRLRITISAAYPDGLATQFCAALTESLQALNLHPFVSPSDA